MRAYITGTGEAPRIHSAVLEVAATQKLSNNYDFEEDAFFQKVKEVAMRIDAEKFGAP
jgi:hypothetical protein